VVQVFYPTYRNLPLDLPAGKKTKNGAGRSNLHLRSPCPELSQDKLQVLYLVSLRGQPATLSLDQLYGVVPKTQFMCRTEGSPNLGGMYSVEIYGWIRRAVLVEGKSERAVARGFGVARETVRKMLRYAVPPGYRRQEPPKRPKLEAKYSGDRCRAKGVSTKTRSTGRNSPGTLYYHFAAGSVIEMRKSK